MLTPWRGDVDAILEAWYPGRPAGSADRPACCSATSTRPAGCRPPSRAARTTCRPPAARRRYPGVDEVAAYNEGVLVGYRWYDAQADRARLPVRLRPLLHPVRARGLRVRATGRAGARVSRPGQKHAAIAPARPCRSSTSACRVRRAGSSRRGSSRRFDSVDLRAGAAKRVGFHARPPRLLILGQRSRRLAGRPRLLPDRARQLLARHRRPRVDPDARRKLPEPLILPRPSAPIMVYGLAPRYPSAPRLGALGGVAERLNAAVSKTVVRRLGVPRVRIPPPPL